MIIDIRDTSDFKRKPSIGVNIPEHHLRKDFEFLRSISEEIIIICTSGVHSSKMVWYLERQGISATHK